MDWKYLFEIASLGSKTAVACLCLQANNFRAHNITARFPDYVVSFMGVGSPPEDTDRGYCSQVALFVRQDPEDSACSSKQSCRNVRSLYTDDSKDVEPENDTCGDFVKEPSFGICTYYSYSRQTVEYERSDRDTSYRLIECVEYPYEERNAEEVVAHDVMYKVNVLGRVNGRYYCDDKDRAEVPLQQLTDWHSDGPFISESELRYYCHCHCQILSCKFPVYTIIIFLGRYWKSWATRLRNVLQVMARIRFFV